MVNPWKAIFGHKIKIRSKEEERYLDHGVVQYIGGHKAYPKPEFLQIYFYEDRIEFDPYKIIIQYAKIKDITNVNESKRDTDRLLAGFLFAPLAIAYLWKKNHIYTIIEYDDGLDINTQKILFDFDNNANYAQGLLYKKMLEYRNKEK